MPKFSVIVPVYNKDKYIEKCLTSIINQTYSDWELIIVNDGSTDNSQNIIDSISLGHAQKIKCIIQNNRGLPAARNAGVKVSTGEFIIHLDSDDWVGLKYLESVYDELERYPDTDILVVDFFTAFSNDKVEYQSDLILNSGYITGNEYCRHMCTNSASVSAWNKIVNRNIYKSNENNFLEGVTIGEDLSASLIFAINSNKVRKLNKAFLYYLQDSDGMTKSAYGEKQVKSLFTVLEYVNKKLSNKISKDYLNTLYFNHAGLHCLLANDVKSQEIETTFFNVINQSNKYYSVNRVSHIKYMLCKYIPFRLGYRFIIAFHQYKLRLN
jgi:glycosyltransferase involved in cell wall biosynthesis